MIASNPDIVRTDLREPGQGVEKLLSQYKLVVLLQELCQGPECTEDTTVAALLTPSELSPFACGAKDKMGCEKIKAFGKIGNKL